MKEQTQQSSLDSGQSIGSHSKHRMSNVVVGDTAVEMFSGSELGVYICGSTARTRSGTCCKIKQCKTGAVNGLVLMDILKSA